jgi:predicted nucleic acid-binding protein
MPDKRAERVYVDSCVFISYLGSDEGRKLDIDALMNSGQKGNVELVTCMIAITEVAFVAAEKKGQLLDDVEEARIDDLWSPRSPVKLIEFHEGIAREARALMRFAIEQGWSLKPMDAIHLAAAKSIGAQRLLTYNLKDFKKFETRTEMAIEEPSGGQTVLPEMTGDESSRLASSLSPEEDLA